MGTDYYSKVVLGFRVTKKDFVRTDHTEIKTCGKGHQEPADHPKFCAQDGTPFTFDGVEVATDALLALMEDPYLNADDAGDWWSCDTDGLVFLVGGEHRDPDEDVYVCGIILAKDESNDLVAYTAISDDDLLEKRKEVEALRTKIGFDDRPIKMYSWVYTL